MSLPLHNPTGDDYFRVAIAVGEFLHKLTPHERQQIADDLDEVEGDSGLYPVSEMLWVAAVATAREEDA